MAISASSASQPVRLLLVDDHEVVRIGLHALLAHHADLSVVGEAECAAEAVEQARELRPDVVLMDIRLPGQSGISACAEIVRECPETRVVMLTSFAEDSLVTEAIAAGASGYVLKQVGSERLLESIRAVARGESPIDPSLTGHLFERVRRSVEQERRGAFDGLSEQELRILALLTEGRTNRDIGQVLALGEKTVRNYVSVILSKLHLASRAEAAAYAVRHHVEEVVDR